MATAAYHHRPATAHNAMMTGRVAAAPLKPDFRDGSILEERDKNGRSVSKYRVGPLLGRGGFAKCYEVTDLSTNQILAVKVIDRASIQKAKILAKLQSEIAIHRRMKHKNIVAFFKTFQDEWYVYIILEKCAGQTLMEISRTRRRFSVAETQHIMIQTLSAMDYMHRNHVIHRDLKLGNIMMDVDMNVKVGDFGLAAELMYDGERKRTICGTPNYIAPEILNGAREGHSFEVDVWSLGVILYTLLVGEPPFQTHDVQATYNRIKTCRYNFPSNVEISDLGKELVHKILQPRPDRRPTLMDIRDDVFFKSPAPPSSAPLTLFPEHMRRQRERDAMARYQKKEDAAAAPRDALKNINTNLQQAPGTKVPALGELPRRSTSPKPQTARAAQPAATARPRSGSVPAALGLQRNEAPVPGVGGWMAPAPEVAPKSARQASSPHKPAAAPANPEKAAIKGTLGDDEEERRDFDKLHQTLMDVEDARAAPTSSNAPPRAIPGVAPGVQAPTVWVTDCANFSEKYGMAYLLNSGHTGVHYNDSTKMVWEPITNKTEYYARVKQTIDGVVHATDQRTSFNMDAAPDALNKKTTLIKYFKSYLQRTRTRKDGVEVVKCTTHVPTTPPVTNMTEDIVYVKRWMVTDQATIFRLSNKTMQVCFNDKTEVILSNELRVVTYTDVTGARQTMPLTAVASQPEEMAKRLRYTKDIICKLINNREI